MMCDLKGLGGGLDANLRQLEGHKRTAIVANGLQNVCACHTIFMRKYMRKYSQIV